MQDAALYAHFLRGRIISNNTLSSSVLVNGQNVPYSEACPHTVWLHLEGVYDNTMALLEQQPARRAW